MTKIILSLLLIVYVLSPECIFGQLTTAIDYNLKGKVKKVVFDSYLGEKTSNGLVKVKKGWEETGEVDKTIEFNESGNITKIVFRDLDGKIKRTDEFLYSNELLVQSVTKYKVIKYIYDAQNRLESQIIIDRTPRSISASNIDELGDEEVFSVQFEYDTTDLKQRGFWLNEKEDTTAKTTYFYNEKEFVIKEETAYFDGLKDWFIYQYDTNGNMLNVNWFDNIEGLLEIESNHYKGAALVSSEWENYMDGEPEGKIVYTYQNGNEIEIIETDFMDESEIKWTYAYEYDSFGNWIKKTVHTYKDEWFIVDRVIEYY
ncbi:hypothetical protein [Brumimicrobium mesophilum]|uniref:hypothetical protein n=1 Tax=Brumimicrobium mesophilum TaxID=392717 RepID=UPI000D142CFC|nr:hypothetical protein [Brumimicrobium mesophilum]